MATRHDRSMLLGQRHKLPAATNVIAGARHGVGIRLRICCIFTLISSDDKHLLVVGADGGMPPSLLWLRACCTKGWLRWQTPQDELHVVPDHGTGCACCCRWCFLLTVVNVDLHVWWTTKVEFVYFNLNRGFRRERQYNFSGEIVLIEESTKSGFYF